MPPDHGVLIGGVGRELDELPPGQHGQPRSRGGLVGLRQLDQHRHRRRPDRAGHQIQQRRPLGVVGQRLVEQAGQLAR